MGTLLTLWIGYLPGMKEKFAALATL